MNPRLIRFHYSGFLICPFFLSTENTKCMYFCVIRQESESTNKNSTVLWWPTLKRLTDRAVNSSSCNYSRSQFYPLLPRIVDNLQPHFKQTQAIIQDSSKLPITIMISISTNQYDDVVWEGIQKQTRAEHVKGLA